MDLVDASRIAMAGVCDVFDSLVRYDKARSMMT